VSISIHGVTRPPYDSELEIALPGLRDKAPSTITPQMIAGLRLPVDEPVFAETLRKHDAVARDIRIAGHKGEEIVVSVIAKRDRTGPGPAFLHLHSGGMVMGNRFDGIDQFVAWAVRYSGVLVTVEYRLAPEFPDPYPIEDCYSTLTWLATHAPALAVDMDRVFLVGASAGGGLAAGTALLSRDRSGPQVAGQLLAYPMLDDRAETLSTTQFEGIGVWDRISNTTGWSALLGSRRGGDDVPIYAAPSRATDLSGLPPAYLEVGSAEVFRDETVQYATAIWAAGGRAELHVWPGAFHACDLLAPDAAISLEMRSARDAWITRLMAS